MWWLPAFGMNNSVTIAGIHPHFFLGVNPWRKAYTTSSANNHGAQTMHWAIAIVSFTDSRGSTVFGSVSYSRRRIILQSMLYRRQQFLAMLQHSYTGLKRVVRFGTNSPQYPGKWVWKKADFSRFLKKPKNPQTFKFRFLSFLCNFWQRVSIACYAEGCLSYDRFCLTDRLTVCLSQSGIMPATIMRSSLEDSPMILVSSTLNFTAKFQGEHRERGRRMREG